jgi:Domain of unknown function (DUF5916)/Carbohydrate family 9 binding domain-like
MTLSLARSLAALALGTQPAVLSAGPTVLPRDPLRIQAARCAQKIIVDGRLDEAVWTSAPPITKLTQSDPIEGADPSERTEVRVAFDGEALYVGARLHDDSPQAISSRLARRDRAIAADSFMVFLDPHRDGRSGVYFGVNAAGTQYDGTLMNDDWRDDSWDGVWESEVTRDQQGWTVEMRIPFSQLRFTETSRAGWGINFERVIARKNEHDHLVYTPRRGSGFVSRFPEMQALGAVGPPRRIELLPYASFRVDTPRDAADPFRSGWGAMPRVGADLKLGIGSHLTLDATVYPDFGQVEVDPAVVNLSDREVFYPERRPFFLEGANVFQGFGMGGARNNWSFNFSNPNLVYSRRIGRAPQATLPDNDYADLPQATDILGAAKLTGKLGHWNVGTLHAFAQREYGRISVGGLETRLEVEPLTYYGATRVQNEMNGGRQGLGLVNTVVARDLNVGPLRDQLNRTATVLGLDGWSFIGPAKTWVITGWTAASRVTGTPERMIGLQQNSVHYFQRPDAGQVEVDPNATSLTGFAGRLAVNKQHGNVIFNSALGVLSPGWEINDLGFGSASDVINGHIGLGYQWPDPGRVFRRLALVPATFASWDFGGNRTWTGQFLSAESQLLNFWGVNAVLIYNPASLSNGQTRGGPLMRNPPGIEAQLGIETDSRKRWQVGLSASLQRYAAGARLAFSTDAYLELRPMDRLTLNLAPSYSQDRDPAQYLETIADPMATATYGNRYLFGDLDRRTLSGNVRLNWIFTPKLSLEFFGQPLITSVHYNSVRQLAAPRTYEFLPTDRDPNEHAFSFVSLRASAVLRWEYRPGSTVYLVWNQNQSVEEKDSRFRIRQSWNSLQSARADTVVMVKASYWWTP